MIDYNYFIKAIESQIILSEAQLIKVENVGWINPLAEKGATAWKSFFLPVMNKEGMTVKTEYKVNSNTQIIVLKEFIADLKAEKKLKQIPGRKFGKSQTTTVTFEDQDLPIPGLSIYLIVVKKEEKSQMTLGWKPEAKLKMISPLFVDRSKAA